MDRLKRQIFTDSKRQNSRPKHRHSSGVYLNDRMPGRIEDGFYELLVRLPD